MLMHFDNHGSGLVDFFCFIRKVCHLSIREGIAHDFFVYLEAILVMCMTY